MNHPAILETTEVLGETTIMVEAPRIVELCRFLKDEEKFVRLSAVTAVDWHPAEPRFEVVYLLHSITPNRRLRIKTKLSGKNPEIDSVIPVWTGANWYEREVFDMFGITFRNHPNLVRILIRPTGRAIRCARIIRFTATNTVTAMSKKPLFEEHVATIAAEQEVPASPSAPRRMTLNMGPQHPSTHGVLRIVLELEGETIISAEPDIGFLHTGIEKECEQKTWAQVATLTDRVDYLSNLANNLVYALAVEKLLQIEIPPKAQWMRVLMAELSRLNSHLVWLGTHALDIGAMSMFFYCFREREDILQLLEMFSGQRMMTSYIRVGGLALDHPRGWQNAIGKFIRAFPSKVDEYEVAAGYESHLDHPHQGRRLHFARRHARSGRHRPDAPRRRRSARHSQDRALFQLRQIQFQRRDAHRKRRLRPVPRASSGNARERQDHHPGDRRHAGWPLSG